MKTIELSFDILSLMIADGAEQDGNPEIRASSVRGQLRWWFRLLGGFKDSNRSIRDQETALFGGAAGRSPVKSLFSIQVLRSPAESHIGNSVDLGIDDWERNNNGKYVARTKKTGIRPDHEAESKGYFLFPLRPDTNERDSRSKGYFLPQKNAFSIRIVWRGNAGEFQKFLSLITIWGALGALGARSRRCMGAIAFNKDLPMPLNEAFSYFAVSEKRLLICKLPNERKSSDETIVALSDWYKSWRSFGPSNARNTGPGKDFAKGDHDIGLQLDEAPEKTVRPALGLPIIQKYSSGICNTWNTVDDTRFASPVLLRPFRISDDKWIGLVLFAEAYKWPLGDMVKIDGRESAVDLSLYEAMKKDPNLRSFDI